jgi:large subunit ribosomal protein L4
MELHLENSDESIPVSELAFGREFNDSLVHQAVTAYLARARMGTKAQKNRASVRGGGAKPWRQKGTGRARAGSIRSPLWRGGGVTFGSGQRNYRQKLNKKMHRAAMRSIISELVRQTRLLVVKEFTVETPKTRDLVKLLSDYSFDNLLIVSSSADMNLYLAARNLPKVDVAEVSNLDPVRLIRFEKVMMTVDAIRQIEVWLA